MMISFNSPIKVLAITSIGFGETHLGTQTGKCLKHLWKSSECLCKRLKCLKKSQEDPLKSFVLFGSSRNLMVKLEKLTLLKQ